MHPVTLLVSPGPLSRVTRPAPCPSLQTLIPVLSSSRHPPRGGRLHVDSSRECCRSTRNVVLARATISRSAVISASAKASVPPALITRGSILSHCPSLAFAT